MHTQLDVEDRSSAGDESVIEQYLTLSKDSNKLHNKDFPLASTFTSCDRGVLKLMRCAPGS